jgi:hypothetical protein
MVSGHVANRSRTKRADVTARMMRAGWLLTEVGCASVEQLLLWTIQPSERLNAGLRENQAERLG